ncbi:hypothetical protein ACVNF4_01835 [Streptomyces sp. S6]
MKRYLVLAASTLLFAAGATSAVAAPSGSGAAPSVKHVNYCNNFVNHGSWWEADCNVDYGRSGSYTQCSDLTTIWGPLVGVGYWHFVGNCAGHGTVRNWGVYDG